mgnify:CR=1 FL=1
MEQSETSTSSIPTDNETFCIRHEPESLRLQCCPETRTWQYIKLLTEAGLCDSKEDLSVSQMAVRLERAWTLLKHDCQGKRNCPLAFRVSDVTAALRNLRWHSGDCSRCAEARKA